MHGVPENNPALRSNVFSHSTWRCEDQGGDGGSLNSERLHACMPACLAKPCLCLFFSPSFFMLCMVIKTSKFILASCPVCFGVGICPFCLFVWLFKCQPWKENTPMSFTLQM